MIISEFAKYLREHNDDLLTQKTTPISLLHVWLESVLSRNPHSNADMIIHKEVLYCKNKQGDYLIAGKSDSGRVLVSALIKFARSYDNYTHSKWMEMTEQLFHGKNSALYGLREIEN